MTAKGKPRRLCRQPSFTLIKGNKDKIKFVQGKFNMGGTGVLEFCGLDHNLQLVVSKRRPDLLTDPMGASSDDCWSFTVIRREDPTGGKSSRFSYLAPIGADRCARKGALLHFPCPSLPIFPDKNTAYVREAEWGTLIKLYEYDAQQFRQNMMRKGGLMYRAGLLLPEPALPIRFHECRQGFSGHSGSFETTMVGLIQTLNEDLDNPKRSNVEWSDKLKFDIGGEQFSAPIYVFKDRDAADTYRKSEGIVFTFNGQSHATMPKDFFRRKTVRQDYLRHSLLMFVDCSHISPRAHEKLFMNSRDRLRNGELARKLEAELEKELKNHEALKELASERRKRELADKPKTTEAMAKVLEDLLAKNPTLANLLGQGVRIKNPHKSENAANGVTGFIGKRFPTTFRFKGRAPGIVLERDAFLESTMRVAFETDAANDYFKRDDEPGECTLYRKVKGELAEATDYHRPRLHNGRANLSMTLPDDVADGDVLSYELQTTDPSRIEPFRNAFQLHIKNPKPQPEGGRNPNTPPGDGPGNEKGGKGDGDKNTRNSGLDIPEPRPVEEKGWGGFDPPFDKFTAMRIMEPPDLDNVYLQSFMKSRPKHATGMKLRFTVGMTLVALSLLLHNQANRKEEPSADTPDGGDVRDRVEQTTSAMAPFLIPLIDSVSELDADDDSLSENAGEAA